MHAVIIGGGTVGFQIAHSLIADGNDVVLIEKDPERAGILSQRLDCLILTQRGNDFSVLREAGIEKADVFVAVTSSDEVNMIACGIVAREFKVPVKIARVRNSAYSAVYSEDIRFLGVDYIVNPEVEAARELITSIRYGASSDIILFEKSNYQIRNLRITANSFMIGQQLRDVMKTLDLPFLVAAVERDGEYIVPSGNTVMRRNDVLYVAGTEDVHEKLFKQLGKGRTEFKNILLVGGGKIGAMVADYLVGSQDVPKSFFRRLFRKTFSTKNALLKIVDIDPVKCRELASRFPTATVLNGDISDEDLFQEEQLGDSDLVIAVTDNQELNIVSALYAKSHGVDRSAVVVSNSSYLGVSKRLGVDVNVSIKQSVANSILAIVRGGYVKSIHAISGGNLEILEFPVDPSSSIAGKQLMELSLPPDCLIIWISRGNETIVPDGRTEIQGGDSVTVIAQHVHFDRLRAYFAAKSRPADGRRV